MATDGIYIEGVPRGEFELPSMNELLGNCEHMIRPITERPSWSAPEYRKYVVRGKAKQRSVLRPNNLFDTIKNSIKEGRKMLLKGYKLAQVRPVDPSLEPDMRRAGEYVAVYDGAREADTVLVEDANGRTYLAYVTEISEPDGLLPECELGQIVCRLDLEPWKARKEKAAKLCELEEKMRKQATETQRITMYRAMAATDPAMKDLLEQYDALMRE